MKYCYLFLFIHISILAQQNEQWETINADYEDWAIIKTARMDLVNNVPSIEYKYLLTIQLELKPKRKKPFLDSATISILKEARMDLIKKNQAEWQGIFVGAETWLEDEQTYFYLKNKINLKQTKKQLKQLIETKYSSMTFCCLKLKKDPHWEQYFKHIYPNEQFMFFKNNQIAINSMKASDDLAKIRKIYHVSAFGSLLNVKYFKEEALEKGFQFEKTIFENDHHFVYIWKEQNLNLTEINATTNQLYRMAMSHNGKYKGWRTLEKF